MKFVSSGLIMAWGPSQGFEVHMLTPLMQSCFMSFLFYQSQFVVLCSY